MEIEDVADLIECSPLVIGRLMKSRGSNGTVTVMDKSSVEDLSYIAEQKFSSIRVLEMHAFPNQGKATEHKETYMKKLDNLNRGEQVPVMVFAKRATSWGVIGYGVMVSESINNDSDSLYRGTFGCIMDFFRESGADTIFDFKEVRENFMAAVEEGDLFAGMRKRTIHRQALHMKNGIYHLKIDRKIPFYLTEERAIETAYFHCRFYQDSPVLAVPTRPFKGRIERIRNLKAYFPIEGEEVDLTILELPRSGVSLYNHRELNKFLEYVSSLREPSRA